MCHLPGFKGNKKDKNCGQQSPRLMPLFCCRFRGDDEMIDGD